MSKRMKVNLTKRQELALRIYARNGDLNEGLIADGWWDEGTGYELVLTPAGLDAVASLTATPGSEVSDG